MAEDQNRAIRQLHAPWIVGRARHVEMMPGLAAVGRRVDRLRSRGEGPHPPGLRAIQGVRCGGKAAGSGSPGTHVDPCFSRRDCHRTSRPFRSGSGRRKTQRRSPPGNSAASNSSPPHCWRWRLGTTGMGWLQVLPSSLETSKRGSKSRLYSVLDWLFAGAWASPPRMISRPSRN